MLTKFFSDFARLRRQTYSFDKGGDPIASPVASENVTVRPGFSAFTVDDINHDNRRVVAWLSL